MRRVYTVNPRRKLILQEAILQMRETRAALGPEMMARLQGLVKDFDPALLEHLGIKPEMPLEPEQPDIEPVDRQKNLLIVMKFLQLKQGNKNVQNQVRTFLSEYHSH